MAYSKMIYFDRSKPFFPFVVHAIAGLWGYKELSAQGLIPPDKRASLDLAEAAKAMPPGLSKVLGKLAQTPHIELLPSLALTVTDDQPVVIDPWVVATEFVGSVQYLNSYSTAPLRMLLLACYEVAKEAKVTGDPLWEFFRHVRNAGAHNGKFKFVRDEPSRDARWRGFEIKKGDQSLDGTPLFKEPDGEGMMMPGDVLHLLHDVELATPGLQVAI